MLSDFSGELATLLERDESGRMQAPRLRRFERRAINRFAFRRDRRAWAWLALLLQAQFAATRRAQPDLDVHCFLAERTAPATLPRQIVQAYRVHIRRRVVFGERLARVGEVVRSPKLCVAVDLIDSGHGTPGDRRTADHYEMSVRLRALVEGRALNE